MKKFKFRGYDAAAVERRGTLEAESYSEAYAALSYQGVTVVNLEQSEANFSRVAENFWLKFKLGGQWRPVFFRELSVMIGVMTLHESLRTLADAAVDTTSKKILSELVAAVEDGETFSAALRRREPVFGGDAIQSVEIGEASGNLQDVTARLASQLERNWATEKKVRSAMYYPVFVILAAIVATVVLINVTLPVFESFFAQQGGDLPFVTKIFLSGGKFLSQHWALTLAAISLTCAGVTAVFVKVEAVKFFVDELKLKTKLLREVELRNFFGRLSFLLESGVTLDKAIQLCASATKNLSAKKVLSDMKFAVERGESFGKLVGQKNFPPLYVGLLVTGEAGGELVTMLRQCESMADFEVEEILRSLPAKAEIVGTLLAGLIVATLAFAVILPILDTTNLI